MGRIVFLLLALFGEMEGTYAAERGAAGRRVGRLIAHPAEEIEYAGQLPRRGPQLGRIATKTAIPKTSLRRYLTDVHR